MNNNNMQVIDQGYLGTSDILDPFALRPWVTRRGQSVVTEIVDMKLNKESGKPEPVFRNRQIFRNALLRKYEWELIDAEVQDVMRQPLVGVNDLLANGLTKQLGGVGISISTYEQLSDMSAADVSMSLNPKKGEGDQVAFTPVSIPIPIVSKPFTLDMRTLDASRRVGESLDTTQARTATRKVREAVEDMLFNGVGITVETATVYGYTNHPKRLTDTAANYGGGDFGTEGNAHKTLVGMIAAAVAAGAPGPYGVYIAPTQYRQIQELWSTGNTAESQLSSILRTLTELKFVRRSSSLADGSTLLVQLAKETVDLAIGMDVTPVSWQEFGGLVNEFRVMTAVAPRIKYDANDQCGVVHATGC